MRVFAHNSLRMRDSRGFTELVVNFDPSASAAPSIAIDIRDGHIRNVECGCIIMYIAISCRLIKQTAITYCSISSVL